jgi:predicted TIM-barrel fold metal-dependent hydrolase
MEAVDKHDLPLIEPVLQASQEQDLPLVLHLSRHDQYLFSEPEALRCLDHILENYPDLRVIVSHCGGENARAVVEAAKNSSRVMLDASRIRETSERSLYKEPARLLDRIASSLSPRQVLYGSDQSWPQYVTNSAELEYLSEVFQPGELKEICIENGRSILKSLGRSRTYQDIC